MGKLSGIGVIVGLTTLLAGVDVVESVLVKEWTVRKHPLLLVAGLASSLTLFTLFIVAIRFAEMSTVTIGWLVLMQTGLMITERVRYGVHHGTDKWIAMGAIVILLAYVFGSQPAAEA